MCFSSDHSLKLKICALLEFSWVIKCPHHCSRWNNSNMKLCEVVFMPPSLPEPHIPADRLCCIWLKPQNVPLSRTGFEWNMCYFNFNFNRKLFIQHINHKILQTSYFIMQPSSNYTQLSADLGRYHFKSYPALELHLAAIMVPYLQNTFRSASFFTTE